jgi:hypothetical protein
MEKTINQPSLNKGNLVIHVPEHAKGDASHPDCETGIVDHAGSNYIFVLFNTSMGTSFIKPIKREHLLTPAL